MNSLIIGNGSISEALENNMCSKGIFVEVISFRTFFKNYYYKSFDFQRFDRIFFVGIDKSNLLKNLLNTFFLIKQLNKKSWKGCFYFFSTQQAIKIFHDKDGKRVSSYKGYYGWIKFFQSSAIKYLSKFKFHIIHLPYVVGKNTNWQNYFQNLAGKRILYLPVRGNSFLAICNVNSMAAYLISNDLKKNNYFFYSEILSLRKCIRNFSGDKSPDIYNVKLSFKEKLIWISKNSFFYIFMQMCRDLIKLNKTQIIEKLHMEHNENDEYVSSLEEKYYFSLNCYSDKINNMCLIKI